MTGTPRPAEHELLDAARWYARLGDVLADAGRRVAVLGELIGGDWPDARGREWAARTEQLGAELGREAGAAAELGAAHARQAGAGRRHTGMRLGGVEAERVEDERGMRIAELPPG
ncbi:hypothetical protein [Pseudonocardia zijingensis]|uniref:Uncharacterized protein n=1 Tax=Pseudonocardia zijingensis TaxID=153376 RepID=A0ABN1NK48_9PSEU